MTQKFHYDTFGLNSELLRKKSQKRVSQRRPRSAMLLLPQRGQRVQDDNDCHRTFYISAYTTGWLGETLQHSYCLLLEKSESRMDMLACHQWLNPINSIHLSQQNSVPSETPGYGLFPNGSKPLWRKTVWKPCWCEQHLKSSNPLPLCCFRIGSTSSFSGQSRNKTRLRRWHTMSQTGKQIKHADQSR